jgi:hypothetical protein
MLDLPHLASRVFGTPLMIARAKLEVILGVLVPRLAGGDLTTVEPDADPPPQTSITVERIAVVSVIGTLVGRSDYLDAASGLLSYGDIGEAIATAMDDPSVRGVVLDVGSLGGEVGGLFDLVEQVRGVCGRKCCGSHLRDVHRRGASRSQRHQLRAEENAIARKERDLVHDARRSDQLIRRISTNIESRTDVRNFPRQRPYVQSREHPNDLGIVQVDRNPAELDELDDLPQHDRGDAPGLGTQQPVLTWAQRAHDRAEQNVRINVQHPT